MGSSPCSVQGWRSLCALAPRHAGQRVDPPAQPARKSAWIRSIEKSNLEHAAAIHLTSELETLELERFGWRLPRLAVIPNGIDEPLASTGDVCPDVDSIVASSHSFCSSVD